jgi:ABC-2 type transport system permease protein
MVVVVVLLFFNHVDLLKTTLLLPLILIEVYIFALGLSLFLSAAFVKYRDINYIWEVVLQAGFYLTPILYPLAKITNVTFQKLIMLNPMAQSIQAARYSVISHDSKVITASRLFEGGWYQYIPFAIVAFMLVFGIYYFRKESKYFAENI